MQDTATQAMTEVALGLSMAFFALLILALISIGLPQQSTQNKVSNSAELFDETVSLNTSEQNTQQVEQATTKQSLLFFWEGEYYDAQMKKVILPTWLVKQVQQTDKATAKPRPNVVVVVPQSTDLQALLRIQASFSPLNIELAQFDSKWQQAFTSLSNTQE